MAHFEGSGKAYPAVMGGHVDAAISGPARAHACATACIFSASPARTRTGLPDVPTLKEQGFKVTPVDQIWYAMATPKVPKDRIAMLSRRVRQGVPGQDAEEQMQKAGEYLKLLTRPQIEEIVGSRPR